MVDINNLVLDKKKEEDKPDINNLVLTPTGLSSINAPTTAVAPPQNIGGNPADLAFLGGNTAPSLRDFGSLSPVDIPALVPQNPAQAGALIGATAAAPLTGGLSLVPAIAASATAGALGAAGATSLSQLYQHVKNFAQGLPFGSNGAPETSGEAASALGSSVVEGAEQGAAGETIGRTLISPIVNSAFKPISNPGRFLPGGAEELAATKVASAEMGIPVTPAQSTQHPVLQYVEHKLRNNPAGAGPLKDFDLNALKKKVELRDKLLQEGNATGRIEDIGLSIQNDLNKIIQKTKTSTSDNIESIKDGILQKLGSNETNLELGMGGQEAAQLKLANAQAYKEAAYNKVSELMPPDAQVVPGNYIQALKDAKAKLETGEAPLRDASGTQKQINLINAQLDRFSPRYDADTQALIDASGPNLSQDTLNNILANKQPATSPSLTYAQMDANAKLLGSLKSDTYKSVGTGESVVYNDLQQALRKDMTSLAQSTGNDELIATHQAANALNANYKNLQDNDLIKMMMDKKPAALGRILFSPENDAQILEFQKAFPTQYPKFKAKATTNLFDSNGKNLSGQVVRDNFAKLGETANTIWKPEEQKMIFEAADAIDGRIEIGDEIAKNPILKNALESRPTEVADKFVRPEEVGPIVMAKKYLPKETVDKIGAAQLRKTLVDDANGRFDPVQAKKVFDTYGKDVYSELYGKEYADQMQNYLKLTTIANTERQISHVPGGGHSNKLFQLAAAIYAFGPKAISAAAIGVAPSFVSKAYLSPFATQWLTEGFEQPAIIKAAKPIAAKLAGYLEDYLRHRGEQQ